jgi:hypothetical protein
VNVRIEQARERLRCCQCHSAEVCAQGGEERRVASSARTSAFVGT